ncbi:MAG: RluA family pseudouridine synthase [Clostridiales bacterium]|nr:RluA family pseudouridine synthase [Clostridiales bacterium]
MPRIIDYTVPDSFDGSKLFRFLRGEVGMSYSLMTSLKQTDSAIKINGQNARTIDRISSGDTVTVTIPFGKCTAVPTQHELDIVYRDEDVLVIYKPPDIAMHPSHGHAADTLANAAAYYLQSIGHSGAFKAVGRLDKGTSGIVICALNRLSASILSGKVDKTYIALCEGKITENGTVDMPIIRPDPDKTTRACSENGERAITHYEVVESFENATLLRLKLDTGRTHQIRVHMAYIGHPLLGDTLYGNKLSFPDHHLLHCETAAFIHPVTKEYLEFSAPMPEDFKKILNDLQKR